MVNGIDETGWNVAAQLRWLWVVVSEQVVFRAVLPSRFVQAGRPVQLLLVPGAGHSLLTRTRPCSDSSHRPSPVAERHPVSVA